ncbi:MULTISPECIES: hypothetical protein [Acinetobacter calcoaceticus/baumannii complex]|uniref:hypothetical protein n=1 Tax=Acinetobacter calcoaceticus/baumannii complex TaxID=909768 RepID=UPI001230F87E|nr:MULTISPECIES: hypothetical protein [Acinetobacter calcoaceticus/baumannii complex]MBR7738998.1 hypothetical protein [Acinetobacter nosocomialis]MDA3537725.1 hypothetical protein [Acinetobacter baumannii]
MTTDIHAWRSEICAQLIRTGKTDIEDVIKDATRLETYVFGETKTAEIKNAEVKTSNPAKTQTVKETKAEKVEEVQETKSETAPVEEPKDEVVEETTKSEITEKEVKDTCLAVAKKDRAALLKILSDIGVTTVATIPTDKYAAVIEACEKALA